MMSLRSKAVLALTALTFAFPVAALAQDDAPDGSRFRYAGEVTAVDVREGAFGLHTFRGEDVRIYTNEETEFHSRSGEVQGLEDMQPGMHAGAMGIVQDDGTLLALKVGVGEPGDRPRPDGRKFAGEIASVSPDQGTFVLNTREGESLTFLTDGETRFVSRDGSIQGLEDIEPGMLAFVLAQQTDDGGLLAKVVAVGTRHDRPKADVRAAGQIVSIGNRSFTLETREGEQMTFLVNESTRYFSRSGEVESFEDLEVGMMVGVAAVTQDDGQLLAVGVAAGHLKRDKGRDA